MIVQAESPSNIALVKYWGKHGVQLPLNPSVSFTLSEAKSITEIQLEESDSFGFSFSFECHPKPEFEPKLSKFFDRVDHLIPELRGFSLKIDSRNTFPHSSGIASSASAFSALSIALAEAIRSIRQEEQIDLKLASD